MAQPTTTGGVAADDSDAPSQRLLDAAIDAFADRGYHATTTRDIASRVGLSPAALYVHYPSKAALLGRISRDGHETALRLFDEELAPPADPVPALRRLMARFSAWHAEQHRVARVVHHELSALDPQDRAVVMAMRHRIEMQMEGHLERGVAAGTMRIADCHRVAVALLSLAVDVARWYDPSGTDTPEAIGELYGELAVRMVGAA